MEPEMKCDNIPYTKLTKWKNEPLQKNLQEDLDEAETSRQLQIAKILEYREDMEGGKPLDPKIRDRGKSTQRPLVMRKQAEWAYPIIEEPFLSTPDMFKVEPNGKDDREKAEIGTMVLNWFMNTKINKNALIGEIARTIYDEGTVIIKNGWKTVEREVEVESIEPIFASPEESFTLIQQAVESGQLDPARAEAMIEMGEPLQVGEQKVTKMETRVVNNHATLEVMDNTNIIVDPTCDGDISKAQFIIHEYETDYATLKAQEYDPKTDKGIYKNLKKVRFDVESETPYDDHDPEEKINFYFKDKPRKKVRAYEYWGFWDIDGEGELTAIVATWIGDVMIRLEKNPYAHQELPFSVARYMPRKKEFWGEPDAKLLKENQETIGVYTRAMHDQTISNALGQKLVDETLFNSPSQWQAYKKGNDARTRPGADPRTMIWESKINPIDKSIFEMINFQRDDAESIIGQKAFDSGISGSALGSTATGVRSAMDATTKRKLGVLRRISNEALQHAARHMLINAQEFMEEETVLRLTDGEFVTVLKQDLQLEFDLRVDINTPEKEEEASNKIAFLLQTTMQTLPLEMSKTLLKKWANINKMPDVAKDIDDIQPPGPTEQEQMMMELEMQKAQLELQNAQLMNEKLVAETAKVYADRDRTDAHTYEAIGRLSDDGGKADKLASEAEYKRAQTRKVHAEADEIDRQHLRALDGIDRQEAIEDAQFKADVDMAKQYSKEDIPKEEGKE